MRLVVSGCGVVITGRSGVVGPKRPIGAEVSESLAETRAGVMTGLGSL